jgi:hypothetical protein
MCADRPLLCGLQLAGHAARIGRHDMPADTGVGRPLAVPRRKRKGILNTHLMEVKTWLAIGQ